MSCDGHHPRVGIFALITNDDGRILIGQRLSTLGRDQWGLPGGHLEQGEDFFGCVERETLEETGLEVRGINILGMTNDRFPALDKHYVSIFVRCKRVDSQSEPQTLEPQKCAGWHWKAWDEINSMAHDSAGPERLFLPVENLIRENPQLCKTLAA